MIQASGGLFITRNFHSSQWKTYKEKYKGKVDIAFFGTSHIYNSMDPRIIEKEYGLRAYNFAGSAERFETSKLVIDQVIGENKIKLAVVDVYPASASKVNGEQSKYFQSEILDKLSFSFPKTSYYSKLFGIENALNVFPTIRKHNRWYEAMSLNYDYINSNIDFYNGFSGEKRVVDKKRWQKYLRGDFGEREPLEKLPNDHKRRLREVIASFKEKNVPVVFTSAPTLTYRKDAYTKQYLDLLRDFFHNEGIEFVDYNLLWKRLKFDKRDFKDLNHTNTKGAQKVSRYLMTWLKKNKKFFKNDEVSAPKLKNNRFFIISEPNDDAIKIDLTKDKVGKQKRIDEVVFYEVGKNRYELVFVGKKRIKNILFKIKYKTKKGSALRIDNHKDGEVVSYGKLIGYNSIFKYNNVNYKYHQFYLPDDFNDFELFIGNQRENKVLSIENKEAISNHDVYNNNLQEDAFLLDSIKALKRIGEFDVETSNYSIKFNPEEGDLNESHEIDRNKTFLLIKNRDTSFFRFGTYKYIKDRSTMQDINWISGTVPKSDRYNLYHCDIPFKQYGNTSITTIGDSQTIYLQAQHIRRKLNDIMPELIFNGRFSDKFGYNHEAIGGRNSAEVLKDIDGVGKADYYTILLGTNDWKSKIPIDASLENLKTIMETLLNKYENSNILYLTPLPTTNRKRDDFNKSLSEMVVQYSDRNERIHVINFGEIIRKEENWEEYLHRDGLHQSHKSVDVMVKIIAEYFNKKSKE